MGVEERNREFSEAQVDAQLVYIEAERDLIAEHQLVVQLESDNSSLQSENDKLRSLVRGLHTNLSDLQRAICNSEDMWGYAKYYKECLISARKLMRELGIEVEE